MVERHSQGPIDFNEEPTSHLRVENRASDPASPKVGDVWLNTTSHALKVQTNTATTTTLGSASGVSKFAVAVGNGALTSFAITHNLGTLDVQVVGYLVGAGTQATFTSVTLTSTNVVTVVIGAAPATNNLRVVVVG